MRLRLSLPSDWQQLAAGHFALRLNRSGGPAEVRVIPWPSRETAGTGMRSPSELKSWIEQVAQTGLASGEELYGATFSELRSAHGWPVTLIEASVRTDGGSPSASRAVRLLYGLQIFADWVAVLVHAEVPLLAADDRASILHVLGSAQPEQSDDAVVALADLFDGSATDAAR